MTQGVEGRRLMPRRALTDDVYEAIKALLMDQEIPAGERISIDGLARDLGVSPTPVREALTRLESEGLATKEPLKGYRSSPLLSVEEFDDLYQFRLLIEPWAARRAAERMDDAGRALLEEEMSTVHPPSGTTYEGYKWLTAHDARFHALVARLSGSRQIQQALDRTHCHLHIFRLHFERSTGTETLAEHRKIADALASGDGVAAEEAMRAHLREAMAVRLRNIYDKAPDDTDDTDPPTTT
ncbi:MAG TPA: GntR family transcriptional regulator [Nocardioidaceae bacterium]|nr:GntR family transcriptional regulator [Nocardioidaceae bacterium]